MIYSVLSSFTRKSGQLMEWNVCDICRYVIDDELLSDYWAAIYMEANPYKAKPNWDRVVPLDWTPQPANENMASRVVNCLNKSLLEKTRVNTKWSRCRKS